MKARRWSLRRSMQARHATLASPTDRRTEPTCVARRVQGGMGASFSSHTLAPGVERLNAFWSHAEIAHLIGRSFAGTPEHDPE